MVSSRKFLELVPQLHRLYVGALSELPLWDDEMKVKHVKKSTKIFAKILVDIFFCKIGFDVTFKNVGRYRKLERAFDF